MGQSPKTMDHYYCDLERMSRWPKLISNAELNEGYHHAEFRKRDTLTFPLPHRTRVPMKATFLRSEILLETFFGSMSVDLSTGSVSPVKLDSSIASSTAWKSYLPSSPVVNQCQSVNQSFVKWPTHHYLPVMNQLTKYHHCFHKPVPAWSSSSMSTKLGNISNTRPTPYLTCSFLFSPKVTDTVPTTYIYIYI